MMELVGKSTPVEKYYWTREKIGFLGIIGKPFESNIVHFTTPIIFLQGVLVSNNDLPVDLKMIVE